MITLALLSFLLVIAQPLALIATFGLGHAVYCTMYGEKPGHYN